MRRFAPALAVAVVVAALLVSGRAAGGDGRDGAEPLGPGVVTVELGVHYSKFSSSRIDVVPGTTVRFVVTNDDPINHELIVGDAEVHRRHELGTEAAHPPRPGEVTVPPGEVRTTTFTFDEPGSVLFACHLPGHFAYGMQGHVVVAAS
jgi:uncharacterized cupredoxin-like copper-binding protein